MVDNEKTLVVVKCWANVITWLGTDVPEVACAGLVVDEDLAAGGAYGHDIIVEGPVEVFPGQ